MQYKCLNPDCGHSWQTRGDYAKIIRCPSCRKGYVLDWDTYEAAVVAQTELLRALPPKPPPAPDVVATAGTTKAKVIRKLFPMLPFNAFQVINEEARQRIRASKQSEKKKRGNQ